MENECYQHLRQIISEFPLLYQFLDDDFILKQCQSELKNYILKRLNNEVSSHDIRLYLPSFEKRLEGLVSVKGYDRLGSRLRGASDWDQHNDIEAQIDITLWFKRKNLLKEIEPKLPCREGYSDILLSFLQQDIYCETHSFQSIIKSIQPEESKTEKEWDELKGIKWAVRHLLKETSRQLPQDYPGILALDATKSVKFAYDVRSIAERLLPQRPQVIFIALWSWEGNGEPSWDMIPNDFFVNSKSKFPDVGKALLGHLGLKGEIIGV